MRCNMGRSLGLEVKPACLLRGGASTLALRRADLPRGITSLGKCPGVVGLLLLGASLTVSRLPILTTTGSRRMEQALRKVIKLV